MPDPQLKTEQEPRPGERKQTWWCDGCKEWHTGSILGDDNETASEQPGAANAA